VDHVVPHYDMESPNPRMQLESATVRNEYSKKYEEQLRQIIEGYTIREGEEEPIAFNSTIAEREKAKPKGRNNRNQGSNGPVAKQTFPGLFPPGSDAADYGNWTAKQTILKGGANIQHPHCDNAVVNSYANLDVFPFVCIHTFGLREFTLWLHPNPMTRAYGFEHTFHQNNLLLMRGDFVHAGGAGMHARAHMEFFPRETAGWQRKKSFWNLKSNKVHATFLWQHPTFPFAFPYASEPDADGDINITYPPQLTRVLKLPFTKKQCKAEGILFIAESKRLRQKRREECAKIQSQQW